jgi:hypothetical protein
MQMRDATAKDIAAIVLLHMESWRSVCTNNPAPISDTKASATWLATSKD